MKKSIFKTVSSYYSEKLLKYGATSKGVDWNDKMTHFLRFEQLDIYSNINKRFSILDYGCGFGSLIEYLNDKKYDFDYFGYDISDEMVKQARTNFPNQMFDTIIEKRKFDFVIANGIFNVKLKTKAETWKKYVFKTIDNINKYANQGFSFNILSSYSDDHMRSEKLFYANPLEIFDFCKKNYSRHVSLIHDYGLYEFTILVKK